MSLVASPDWNTSQFAMMWTAQHAQDDPAAAALIESWLVSGDLAKARVATIGFAGGWAPDIRARPVAPRLVALSNRPEEMVREAAAQYAGLFGQDFDTDQWRRQLLNDESANVRAAALGSICYRSVDSDKFEMYKDEAFDALRYGTDEMAAQVIWGLAQSACQSERLWRIVPGRVDAIHPTRRLDLVRDIAFRSSPARVDVMLAMADTPELRSSVSQSLAIMVADLEPRHLDRMRALRDGWLAAGDSAAAEAMTQTIDVVEQHARERSAEEGGEVSEP